jgi:hypothetical protein
MIVDAAGPTDGVRAVPLAPIYLKGMESPVQHYSIVGEAEEVQPSWLDRVLDVIAKHQENSEEDFFTGLPLIGPLLHMSLEIDVDSEEGIAVTTALEEAENKGLVTSWGEYHVRLTPSGWHVARGRVPGSERDPEFLRAVVEVWRDPSVRHPQPDWISMVDVFAHVDLQWDPAEGRNAAERLQQNGFIVMYDKMNQDTWVRPTGVAFVAIQA